MIIVVVVISIVVVVIVVVIIAVLIIIVIIVLVELADKIANVFKFNVFIYVSQTFLNDRDKIS